MWSTLPGAHRHPVGPNVPVDAPLRSRAPLGGPFGENDGPHDGRWDGRDSMLEAEPGPLKDCCGVPKAFGDVDGLAHSFARPIRWLISPRLGGRVPSALR